MILSKASCTSSIVIPIPCQPQVSGKYFYTAICIADHNATCNLIKKTGLHYAGNLTNLFIKQRYIIDWQLQLKIINKVLIFSNIRFSIAAKPKSARACKLIEFYLSKLMAKLHHFDRKFRLTQLLYKFGFID